MSVTPFASPATSTPWVPLWPLAPTILSSEARNRVVVATNNITGLSSFTPLPAGADRTALNLTFTKRQSDTKLILRMAGTAALVAGASQAVDLGMRVTGVGDYLVGSYVFPAPVVRCGISGYAEVVGLASGTYLLEPVFRSATGSVTLYGGDFVSFEVQELLPTFIPLVTAGGWTDAGETWTYASADAPTFTFTVAGDLTGKYSPGMRLKLTQTTDKYFIVTKVAYSAGTTTVTVYGGTDYTLANATITGPYYSTDKAPVGFPLDPTKWTVAVTDSSLRQQSSPTQNTWYNLGSVTISVPIGCWDVSYDVSAQVGKASATGLSVFATLSTANNSESSAAWTAAAGGAAFTAFYSRSTKLGTIVVAAKTSYFLNTKTDQSGMSDIFNRGDLAPTLVRAVCAYL